MSAASPPSSPPPPPLRLPDPVRDSDPHLFSAALRNLHRSLLTPAQRATIGNTLAEWRCAEHVGCLSEMSTAHLAILATIVHAALIEARSWGGRPSVSVPVSLPPSRQEEQQQDHPGQEEEPDAVPSMPSPPAPPPPPLPASFSPVSPVGYLRGGRWDSYLQTLAAAFHADRVVPIDDNATADARRRRHSRKPQQRSQCAERQLQRCPISRLVVSNATDCIHLLPYSVAAVLDYDTSAFWFFLSIVLGCDLRDRVWELAGGDRASSPANGLVLDASLNALVDQGSFWLVPADTTHFPRHYDLELRCMDTPTLLENRTTVKQRDPDQQVTTDATRTYALASAAHPRLLADGDRFRVFTNDPDRLPLPHPLLLDLRHMLWTMIGSLFLAERTKPGKRKRDDMSVGTTSKRSRGASSSGGTSSHRGSTSATPGGGADGGLGEDAAGTDTGNGWTGWTGGMATITTTTGAQYQHQKRTYTGTLSHTHRDGPLSPSLTPSPPIPSPPAPPSTYLFSQLLDNRLRSLAKQQRQHKHEHEHG